MGDMGDYYRDLKEAQKEKRADNRESSRAYLDKHDIPYTVKNNGAHLIVEGSTCFIDFWPGTGRWVTREGKGGFGVRNLVNHIKTAVEF